MTDKPHKLFTEDWLAVWIGAVVILLGCVAVLTGWFDFSALKFSTWHFGDHTIWAQLGHRSISDVCLLFWDRHWGAGCFSVMA